MIRYAIRDKHTRMWLGKDGVSWVDSVSDTLLYDSRDVAQYAVGSVDEEIIAVEVPDYPGETVNVFCVFNTECNAFFEDRGCNFHETPLRADKYKTLEAAQAECTRKQDAEQELHWIPVAVEITWTVTWRES